MRSPLITARRVLLGVSALVLTLCLLPARWTAPAWAYPLQWFDLLLAPVTSPLGRFSAWARHQPTAPTQLGSDAQLQEDFAQLLQYARSLEQQLRTAQDQVTHLTQLRERIQLQSIQLQQVQVVAGVGNLSAPRLTINRGSADGLAPRQVVADGFHLVGKLSEVGVNTARVDLITWPGRELMVRIVPATPGASPREARAAVQWSVKDEAFTVKMGSDQPVKVGDLAHLDDERWPTEASALVVGRVTAVDPWPDDPLLYRLVVITPMRPLNQLSRAVVLTPAEDKK